MPFRIRASIFSILVERPPREILSGLLGFSSAQQQQQYLCFFFKIFYLINFIHLFLRGIRGSGPIGPGSGSPSPSIAPSPTASPAPQELETKLRDWSSSICGSSDVEQLPFSFLGMISVARLHPAMLKYATHIRPVEEKMCQLLINASPDTKASSGTVLCKN
jgi:hypothetical protein